MINFVIRVRSLNSSFDCDRFCTSHHMVEYVACFQFSLVVTCFEYAIWPYARCNVSASLLVMGLPLWYNIALVVGNWLYSLVFVCSCNAVVASLSALH